MMWHWKGLVAGALGVAFIVGVLLHDLSAYGEVFIRGFDQGP
jgi:hypothetical protein